MRISLPILILFAWASLLAQEPPVPSISNTFYILPLFENLGKLPETQVSAEMDKLILQFGGKGNRYHKIGFAKIMPAVPQLDMICRLADSKGLKFGVILTDQTHTSPTVSALGLRDFRIYQWRMDGLHWRDSPSGGSALEINPDARDSRVVTPSRYCRPVQEWVDADLRSKADDLLAMMRKYPGVIVCVNAVIEEELAVGGRTRDQYLADYSPYAVAEFRDWLRHRGIYDADSGTFAGEGASESITGPWVRIAGRMRSPFYDDPDPAAANGTGMSFNESFTTVFRTWTLRNWDLQAFPAPITDSTFRPAPESGAGFTSGGFDAPRGRAPENRFWQAWSWDPDDHGGAYPPGFPDRPAYGFRQALIRNYVADRFRTLKNAGIPAELLFPHQIPGEMLGTFTGGASRMKSGASTLWSGYLSMNGNAGYTRFGSVLPADTINRMTALNPASRGWGIFEYHPSPHAAPQSQGLYDAARSQLEYYHANGCHYLFPGWWHAGGEVDSTFPMNDSRFTEAIKDFLATRADLPYPGATRSGIAIRRVPRASFSGGGFGVSKTGDRIRLGAKSGGSLTVDVRDFKGRLVRHELTRLPL